MANATAPNYSAADVAAIVESAPLDFDKAMALGEKLGKSHRSIISKARSLGVEYVAKPKATKKPAGPKVSKSDIVAAIAAKVGVDNLEGLEKATGLALAKLLKALV